VEKGLRKLRKGSTKEGEEGEEMVRRERGDGWPPLSEQSLP